MPSDALTTEQQGVKRYSQWCAATHGHQLAERKDGMWVEFEAYQQAIIHADRLFNALHEIVELNYKPDDDHRRVLKEADDAIGRDMGDYAP